MSYRLGDILPNPFRNIERYPIDRAKVEALKASIDRTSFWDNVVARPHGDQAQLAYGHHRLVALKELYGPNHQVGLIVRDLDDASMLHIMADENMTEWTSSAPVVVETVRAVRDFLIDTAPAGGRRGSNGETPGRGPQITTFLGWPSHRVLDAVAIINAEERGVFEPEDTADLGIEQATVMRRAVERIHDPVVRRAAVSRVRAGLTSDEPTVSIGKRGIADVVNQVREEARGGPRPRVPSEIASRLYRDIEGYFRTTLTVNAVNMTRSELIRLVAENRNSEELIYSVRPWADQIADALDAMSTEASRLAELLRAEQAVAVGA